MLTHVYRYGPSRHRILKGFVISGAQPERVVSQVLKQWSASSFNLVTDSRFPTSVWIDTGFVWLHTTEARSSLFTQLAEVSRTLSAGVGRAGGRLLPNGVRISPSEPWTGYLCSDRHFLETIDDSEKEVYCNLLRVHLPVLIALTARAGVSLRGVEPVASRLLADSSHHLAARYLASVSPQHLQRVVQCLRRDQGVGRIELLDVCPFVSGDESGVEIRFTDGQLLLTSVRAQALLYQALLIRARRLTRSGRRIGNVRQSLIERNRARAITDGMQARFETDERKVSETQGPRTSSKRGSSPNGSNGKNSKEFVLARDVALDLLEDLAGEFHVLEANFAEIAPLVIGPGLRAIGLSGLQNESDLIREWVMQSRTQGFDLLSRLPEMIYQFSPEQDDVVTALNKNRFGHATNRIQRWWDLLLETSVRSRSESVSTNSDNDRNARSANQRSPERDATGAQRSQREPSTSVPRSESTERSNADRQRGERPQQPRIQPDSLTRAATELLKELRRLGPTASKSEYSSALIAFERASGSSSLNRAAASLSPNEANELGALLESFLTNPQVSDGPSQGWDTRVGRSACERARREGLATLLLRASRPLEGQVIDTAQRMIREAPPGISAFFLQRKQYDVGGPDLTGVRLVLARKDNES